MEPFRTVTIVIVALVIIIFILACMVLMLASKEVGLWSSRPSYVFWPAQLSACTAYAHYARRS
jgi:hypothetical protein